VHANHCALSVGYWALVCDVQVREDEVAERLACCWCASIACDCTHTSLPCPLRFFFIVLHTIQPAIGSVNLLAGNRRAQGGNQMRNAKYFHVKANHHHCSEMLWTSVDVRGKDGPQRKDHS